jgi:hypothetical protein
MAESKQAQTSAKPESAGLLILLLCLGLASVASLALAPLETMLPPEVRVPRAILLVQPAILVIAAVVLGWWATPKIGLGAPVFTAMLRADDWSRHLRQSLVPAFVVALASGAILIGYGALTAQAFAGIPSPEIPLISKLAYGGIGEELIARWGVLSAAMLLMQRIGAGSQGAFWAANVIAAGLFALGHFGVLFALVPDPAAWLITLVLAGNILPALGFGWLFRRYGLEAAIIAHAGTHGLAALAAMLIAA